MLLRELVGPERNCPARRSCPATRLRLRETSSEVHLAPCAEAQAAAAPLGHRLGAIGRNLAMLRAGASRCSSQRQPRAASDAV